MFSSFYSGGEFFYWKENRIKDVFLSRGVWWARIFFSPHTMSGPNGLVSSPWNPLAISPLKLQTLPVASSLPLRRRGG